MDRREPICNVWEAYISQCREASTHAYEEGPVLFVPIGSHLDGIERVYEISARTTMEDPIHTRCVTRGTGSCWAWSNAKRTTSTGVAEYVL